MVQNLRKLNHTKHWYGSTYPLSTISTFRVVSGHLLRTDGKHYNLIHYVRIRQTGILKRMLITYLLFLNSLHKYIPIKKIRHSKQYLLIYHIHNSSSIYDTKFINKYSIAEWTLQTHKFGSSASKTIWPFFLSHDLFQ